MQQPELSPCRSSFSDMKLHTDQRCEWPDLAMSQLTRYLTFRTCSTSLLLCVRDSFLNLLLSKRIWHSTASALLSGRFCVAASMSARSLADVCAFALACSALAGFPIVCPWPRCAETADTCRSNPSVLDIYRRMVACMGPTKLRHAGFANCNESRKQPCIADDARHANCSRANRKCDSLGRIQSLVSCYRSNIRRRRSNGQVSLKTSSCANQLQSGHIRQAARRDHSQVSNRYKTVINTRAQHVPKHATHAVITCACQQNNLLILNGRTPEMSMGSALFNRMWPKHC